jgi:hypothetical protein
MARPVRLERTTCGFEVRRSIQLSYGRIGVSEGTRTLDHWGHNPVLYPTELHSPPFFFILMFRKTLQSTIHIFLARLEGFEPPAYGLEVRSSIHLSYRRLISKYTTPLAFRQGQFCWGFLSIRHFPTCRPRRPKLVKLSAHRAGHSAAFS